MSRFLVGFAVLNCMCISGCRTISATHPPEPSRVQQSAFDDERYEERMNTVLRDLSGRPDKVFSPKSCADVFERTPQLTVPLLKRGTTIIDTVDLYRQAASATFAIYANTAASQQNGGSAFMGTAFVIDPSGVAVTCFHTICFRDPFVLCGCDSTGKKVGVKRILGIFPREDLAFIELDGTDFKSFPLRDDCPPGTRIEMLGHPLGMHFFMSEGLLARYELLRLASGDSHRVLIDLAMQAAPGSSGAPVFDLMGNAIGMSESIREVTEGAQTYMLSSAIPSSVILDCLTGKDGRTIDEGEKTRLLQPHLFAAGPGVLDVPLPEGRIIIRLLHDEAKITVIDATGSIVAIGNASDEFLQTVPDWAKQAIRRIFPNGIGHLTAPSH